MSWTVTTLMVGPLVGVASGVAGDVGELSSCCGVGDCQFTFFGVAGLFICMECRWAWYLAKDLLGVAVVVVVVGVASWSLEVSVSDSLCMALICTEGSSVTRSFTVGGSCVGWVSGDGGGCVVSAGRSIYCGVISLCAGKELGYRWYWLAQIRPSRHDLQQYPSMLPLWLRHGCLRDPPQPLLAFRHSAWGPRVNRSMLLWDRQGDAA